MQVIASGKVVQIDEQDLPLFRSHPWRVQCGYLIRRPRINGKRVLIHFHREILCAPIDKLVDHVNRDRLDNRRENLRLCTHAENMRNRSRARTNRAGVKGVYLDAATGTWRAQIKVAGRKHTLGRHRTAEAAAAAYASACQALHGAFARIE